MDKMMDKVDEYTERKYVIDTVGFEKIVVGFTHILGMMQVMEGKKARIIIDYDPDKRTTSITTRVGCNEQAQEKAAQ